MSDKKLYLLAVLDDNTQKIFEKIYDEFVLKNDIIGKQTKNIPYHISLCSFTTEKQIELEKLLDKIDEENDFKEIKIKYTGMGLFGLNVLYFNLSMSKELIELYDYVKTGSYEEKEELAAHTTVLIDTPENIINIIKIIGSEFKGIEGKIEYIDLYEFFPTKIIKRIKLKEENVKI
jgi:2'-5' RNA ligase